MKVTILVQDLQQYQAVKKFEKGQPVSVTNSTITFPTTLTIEVDDQHATPEMTFAQFDEKILKQ